VTLEDYKECRIYPFKEKVEGITARELLGSVPIRFSNLNQGFRSCRSSLQKVGAGVEQLMILAFFQLFQSI
jgi:hypothetical protein